MWIMVEVIGVKIPVSVLKHRKSIIDSCMKSNLSLFNNFKLSDSFSSVTKLHGLLTSKNS